ncbi:MAG: exodeoxyribonuclease VII small subunit [Alphaproteobacteria bacterium]
MPKKNDDITKLSFEDALGELETIVRDLESGSRKLDEAIDAYERGATLKKHCEGKLSEAQTRIDKISLSPDGTLQTEPANFE